MYRKELQPPKRSFIGYNEVSKDTMKTVFKNIFLPTLKYSSESLIHTSKHKSELQAMKIRYLRRVKEENQNGSGEERGNMTNLDLEPAAYIIEERWMRWYGPCLPYGW